MPTKKFTFEYADKLLRPENADTQIGWTGVPLDQTCGYTGMIKRATIPTNQHLGFDPDYKSVDAAKIAGLWLELFNKAVEANDADAVCELITDQDPWFRDAYALTWDTRSIRGKDSIRRMLKDRLPLTAIRNVKIHSDRAPELEAMGEDLSFVTFHFEFDFKHGTGSGVVRLAPYRATTGSKEELTKIESWKALHVSTTIDTIQGRNPDDGSSVKDTRAKLVDPLQKARTYREIRADEVSAAYGWQPKVLIVGAGHCGLMLAARFKMLGIPTLIVEKGSAPGCSWTNRYDSLSLHNPTSTNHFPGLPFPSHYPDFIPAQQLGDFMENYAKIMEFNVWTESEIDGENAVFDEKTETWTVAVNRKDSQKILHPKYIILAVGFTGSIPNLPQVPGLMEFEKAGGTVVHSSRHKTTPEMKGKKAIVVGGATSAHDLCWELHDNGLDVTMIQRSSTHVISVQKGVRMLYARFESVGKPGGYTLPSADRATWLANPFPLTYELSPRLVKAVKAADEELQDSIIKRGYRVNDGFHGSGLGGLGPINFGGFFFDTGFLKLIADGKVSIEHSEVDHLQAGSAVLKDGKVLNADVIIYANGYWNVKTPIEAVMGKKMADKCDEWLEKGNAFVIDSEGEHRTYYRTLPQKNLFVAFQQFGHSRYFSGKLALLILAQELGIDTTPYAGDREKTPRVAEAKRPRAANQ